MIYVELLAGLFTIFTAYLHSKGELIWGARTGMLGQIFWLVFIFGSYRCWQDRTGKGTCFFSV